MPPVDGVGRTALIIAYLREVETERPDRLFADPYARRFIDAAGIDRPDPEQTSAGHAGPHGAPWVSVRTRFIDDALLDAAVACRQVVLLGAGLDTRAFRVDWPSPITVFEVDTSVVFEFKEPVLEGAEISAAARVLVRGDVTDELATRLDHAGFDPDVPTAWVAEGLLLYLTPAENDELLTTVAELSAPASRLILTLTPAGQGAKDDAAADEHRGWRHTYRVSDGPADPVGWLADHGWATGEPEHIGDLARRYGRAPSPEDDPSLPPRRLLIDATRMPNRRAPTG